MPPKNYFITAISMHHEYQIVNINKRIMQILEYFFIHSAIKYYNKYNFKTKKQVPKQKQTGD